MSKIYDALQKQQGERKDAKRPDDHDRSPGIGSTPPPTPPPPVAGGAGDASGGEDRPQPPQAISLPSLDSYPEHFWTAVTRVGSAIQTVESSKGTIILFTGVEDGAGVSTLALGVATLLVRDPGVQVLLIDAHARPDRSPLLPMGTRGLIQLGLEQATLRDVIVSTDLRGLSYAPRGSGSYNGPKLFESILPLFPDLRTRYDYLIIDSAPVLAAPETAVLCGVADGVVVVVDSEKTVKSESVRTRTILEQHQAPIIGTVVNRVRRSGLFGAR